MRARSLKTTILFSFILVSFICCITLFFIAVRYSRIGVRSIVTDDISIITDRIDDTIGEVIQEKIKFMEYTSNLNELQDSSISLQEKQAFLAPMSKDKEKDLISVSFIDSKGDAYIGNNMKMNFLSAPIVVKVLQSNESVLMGPTTDSISKELSINIGTPIKDSSNALKGILLARLDCKFLNEIASRIKVGKSGYAIFVDRATGATIGAPDVKLAKESHNLKELAEAENNTQLSQIMQKVMEGEKSSGYANIDGERRLLVYRPLTRTNWSVLLIADEWEFIGKLKFMETLLFILTAVLLVVSLITALFVAKNLSPLKTVGDAIKEISTGNADLTQRLSIKHGKKEILEIVNGFNAFVAKLQEIITSVKNSEAGLITADKSLQSETNNSAEVINEIIQNIQGVNTQILNQAASVDETAGAVNQIASNIESLEKMIQTQSEGVSQASAAVEQMVGNISSVNKSVDIMFNSFSELETNTNIGIKTQSDVNEVIKQVESESKSLQDANSAIANIASQTNLLAMNAAIEAAHAGETGKGFSVVADEIRKLSETSSAQSKKIGEELKKIQESINAVVSASSKATTAFTSVSESIQNTDQLVRQIKGAMEEQQIGSKQITNVLHAMNDSTIEVRSASSEMAEGNKHILVEINRLQDVTSIMKDSMSEMSDCANKISNTGTALSEVSKGVTTSIKTIKGEIDQFKV